MIIVMKPGAPMQECEKIKNGLINNVLPTGDYRSPALS